MGLWDEQGNPRAYNFPGPRTNAPSYYNEFSLFQKQTYDLLYTTWINASENARKAEAGLKEKRDRLEKEKNTVPIHAWRLVDGGVVYIKATNASFVPVTGKVIEVHPDGILADVGRYYPAQSETCFIASFPFEVVDGQELGEFWVRHVGRKSFTTVLGATRTVTLLDYGKPCSPAANSNDVQRAFAKLSPAAALDLEAMEKNRDSVCLYADEAKQKLEAYAQGIIGPRLKAKEAAAKQREETTLKNLNWNLQEAERGNAYGLLRMGERYRDGDGVEKDLGKAKEYLLKLKKQVLPML